MKKNKKYWFPAKKYGWGWGPPMTWQGWLVMIIFVAVVTYTAIMYPPDKSPVVFLVNIVSSVLIFIAICWLKGEPPKWRWGGKK